MIPKHIENILRFIFVIISPPLKNLATLSNLEWWDIEARPLSSICAKPYSVIDLRNDGFDYRIVNQLCQCKKEIKGELLNFRGNFLAKNYVTEQRGKRDKKQEWGSCENQKGGLNMELQVRGKHLYPKEV